MMTRCIAAVLYILLVPALASPQTRLKVFVDAVHDAAGLIDPDVRDSVRDIQREIPKRKHLRLITVFEDAHLWVMVSGRRISDGGTFTLSLPGSGSSTTTVIGNTAFSSGTFTAPTVLTLPVDTRIVRGWVSVMQPFSLYADGGPPGRAVIGIATGGIWRSAAIDATKELDRWVEANHDAIEELLSTPHPEGMKKLIERANERRMAR